MNVYGTTKEEHDSRLDAVLRTIYTSGLKLNRNKREYQKSDIGYFGHIISGEGIRPRNSRIIAIRDMPPPINISLRCVVGMINYLGGFIPDLATARPSQEVKDMNMEPQTK